MILLYVSSAPSVPEKDPAARHVDRDFIVDIFRCFHMPGPALGSQFRVAGQLQLLVYPVCLRWNLFP